MRNDSAGVFYALRGVQGKQEYGLEGEAQEEARAGSAWRRMIRICLVAYQTNWDRF